VNVLIEADELAAQLAGDNPPVVADVRWNLGQPSRRPDYLIGHIPDAQFVDLETDLSDPSRPGGRHPLPDAAAFQQTMRRIGVSNQHPVVIYDDSGALAAARLWWMLNDAGKHDVAVLNGGYWTWIDTDHPTEAGEPDPAPPGDFESQPGQLPTIDGDQLAAAIRAGQPPAVIDVRAPERYTGETEPMDPAAGHIPGAINVPSMSNIGSDGRFLDPAQIAKRYRTTAGEDAAGDGATGGAEETAGDGETAGDEETGGVEEPPVVYCGSGITAAHTVLSRAVAGLGPATLYPGSWSDWVTDPQRPVATGEHP
jgi:thiosulfate/3-mercaptopyruvate sulfurtransferase